jgi:hypothetical protein
MVFVVFCCCSFFPLSPFFLDIYFIYIHIIDHHTVYNNPGEENLFIKLSIMASFGKLRRISAVGVKYTSSQQAYRMFCSR